MTALRVLVVEDEVIIGRLLAAVLEGMGHDICAVAATETEAVAEATRCKPDFMIVDALLGRGSGITAMAAILLDRFVPHLFVTGDALRVQMLRPDAVILQKPFMEADLARAMARALT